MTFNATLRDVLGKLQRIALRGRHAFDLDGCLYCGDPCGVAPLCGEHENMRGRLCRRFGVPDVLSVDRPRDRLTAPVQARRTWLPYADHDDDREPGSDG